MPSKPDTSPSPVAMVKSLEKKYQNDFCVATSPLTTVWGNVSKVTILKRLILRLQQEKMIDFDYYEEYLRNISDKIYIMMAVLRKANFRLWITIYK